jgi:hypothetical protein
MLPSSDLFTVNSLPLFTFFKACCSIAMPTINGTASFVLVSIKKTIERSSEKVNEIEIL